MGELWKLREFSSDMEIWIKPIYGKNFSRLSNKSFLRQIIKLFKTPFKIWLNYRAQNCWKWKFSKQTVWRLLYSECYIHIICPYKLERENHFDEYISSNQTATLWLSWRFKDENANFFKFQNRYLKNWSWWKISFKVSIKKKIFFLIDQFWSSFQPFSRMFQYCVDF